jgi:hypothetical protein
VSGATAARRRTSWPSGTEASNRICETGRWKSAAMSPCTLGEQATSSTPCMSVGACEASMKMAATAADSCE